MSPPRLPVPAAGEPQGVGLANTELGGRRSWLCGLFRSESRASFLQPVVPLQVCIHGGRMVMVLGSLGCWAPCLVRTKTQGPLLPGSSRPRRF